jgi:hypothetical protein
MRTLEITINQETPGSETISILSGENRLLIPELKIPLRDLHLVLQDSEGKKRRIVMMGTSKKLLKEM